MLKANTEIAPSLRDTIDTQPLYSRRATAPKTAARPAPAPVAALMAPALKAGWEGEGEPAEEPGVPVAPALGTRGVEVATLGTTGMLLLLARGVEEGLGWG
jgi:hypothetical protein